MGHDDTPVASVIVPTHRGAHRLRALLQPWSTRTSPSPGSWSSSSTASSTLPSHPRAWSDRLTLRVLSHPQPLGVVVALNDGYAAARGRVLIRCDDDLTPGPT